MDLLALDGFEHLNVQNFNLALLVQVGCFSPQRIHAHSRGLFLDGLPAVFVIGDLGEQAHDLNGLLAWWVWIPSLASQSLAFGIDATEQSHWQQKMDMKT